MASAKAVKRPLPPAQRGWKGLLRNINRSKYMLLLVLPGTLYLFVFNYIPMYGVLNAFNDLNISKGTLDSPWVGFHWFEQFFSSIYFYRLFSNTVILSFWTLVWGFPMPILFALLLNEVKNQFFKRTVQSISYFPHFISIVVVVGIMYNLFSSSDGILYKWLANTFGITGQILGNADWFRPLYVGSEVWQNFGWNSIIFLGALSAVDPQLYEAAKIDGANRYRMMMSITLPSIMPTVVTMLILSVGGILSVGADKVILLYSPAIYETSDVIGTYIYRDGILGSNYSFSTAIGLFTSVIGFVLLTATNQLSKKVNEVSLW